MDGSALAKNDRFSNHGSLRLTVSIGLSAQGHDGLDNGRKTMVYGLQMPWSSRHCNRCDWPAKPPCKRLTDACGAAKEGRADDAVFAIRERRMPKQALRLLAAFGGIFADANDWRFGVEVLVSYLCGGERRRHDVP